MSFDAVILAGGGSSRMDGRDKAAELVGGSSLFQRALAAAAEARHVVVVGPKREMPLEVIHAIEDPPGGGPVAGIAAALKHLESDQVVILGCDMPFVSAPFVGSLLDALTADAACAVDDEGRIQYLPCAFRADVLTRCLDAAQVHGAPLRSLFAGLDVTLIAGGGVTLDCDTPEALEAARRAVEVRDS